MYFEIEIRKIENRLRLLSNYWLLSMQIFIECSSFNNHIYPK